MDKLKNKVYKRYDYVSRYQPFPVYYNTLDDKYIYGITGHINKNIDYTIHKVKDFETLDLLANAYYGRPDLYWIIADFNDILDPLEDITKYESLRIPNISRISFGD